MNIRSKLAPVAGSQARKPGMIWVAFAIISHTAWGGYPVLARYLQNTHHIATMSLSAMTNILAVAILLILMARSIDLRVIGIKETLLFAVIVVSRGLLNLYAARHTYPPTSYFSSSPLVVAFLSKTFLKEALPKHTGLALCLSLLGSVLMIFGASNVNGATKTPGSSNWLGILLSIIGGILLAFLMLAIRTRPRKGLRPRPSLSCNSPPSRIMSGEALP